MRERTRFTFFGVRGSTPSSGIDTGDIGGHTSCSSIFSSEGDIVILDTGTGVFGLGQSLMRKSKGRSLKLSILYTHFHLDHIQGLPFFAPLYSPQAQITFYSHLSPKSTEACLNRMMGGRFFPVRFGETSSKKIFRKIPSGDFRIGGFRVSSCNLIHPQGSLAFRFQKGSRSVVLATDTEHPEDGLNEELISLSLKADALIYDAMFTPAEYRTGKKGWGHSTWLEGTKLAREAGVKKLYLSHFNPAHSEKKIKHFVSRARRIFPATFAAGEGKTIGF